MKQRECLCGCAYRNHFESVDDGAGCVNHSWCDHFTEDSGLYDYEPRDERYHSEEL